MVGGPWNRLLALLIFNALGWFLSQLRCSWEMNEIKHLLYLNVLTLSFLLCFDCAYLTCLLLRSWAQAVPKRRYWGYSGVFWGREREIPHSPHLAHKSSITLATQGTARLSEQSRDGLVPIRLLLLRGSAKWRIRDAQECPKVEQFCPLVLRCREPKEMSTLDKRFWGYWYAWNWLSHYDDHATISHKQTLHLTGIERSNARVAR